MKNLMMTLVTITLSLAPCWSQADTKIDLDAGSSATIYASERTTVTCSGGRNDGGGTAICFCRYVNAWQSIVLSGGKEIITGNHSFESYCEEALKKIAACK